MNNLKLSLGLLFASLIIVSCASDKNKSEKAWNLVLRDGILFSDSLATEPFTGHYKGKVFGKTIEYDVINGKQNGIFVLYHENGNIETLGYMKENKNHGEWKYYFSNGLIESQGIFNEDQPDSLWNWYYMTGTLMQEGKFSNGKKEGEWKYYDEFGNLYLMINYRNDEVKDSIRYELPVMSTENQKDSIN